MRYKSKNSFELFVNAFVIWLKKKATLKGVARARMIKQLGYKFNLSFDKNFLYPYSW